MKALRVCVCERLDLSTADIFPTYIAVDDDIVDFAEHLGETWDGLMPGIHAMLDNEHIPRDAGMHEWSPSTANIYTLSIYDKSMHISTFTSPAFVHAHKSTTCTETTAQAEVDKWYTPLIARTVVFYNIDHLFLFGCALATGNLAFAHVLSHIGAFPLSIPGLPDDVFSVHIADRYTQTYSRIFTQPCAMPIRAMALALVIAHVPDDVRNASMRALNAISRPSYRAFVIVALSAAYDYFVTHGIPPPSAFWASFSLASLQDICV